APALRPPAPHAIVGDRHIDFVPAGRTHEGADRLLVAPGTQRTRRDGEGGGASGERQEGAGGALAEAAATVQACLPQALDAGEHWESGEPVPSTSSEKGARSPQREHHPTTMAAADDRAPTGAGRPTDAQAPAAQRAGGTGSEQAAGGPGAGAGTDTDPSLYGEPRGGAPPPPIPGPAPFALGVRPRTLPPPAAAHPPPASAPTLRAAGPAPPSPTPPAFAPPARRLFAHPPPGEGDPRCPPSSPPHRSATSRTSSAPSGARSRASSSGT